MSANRRETIVARTWRRESRLVVAALLLLCCSTPMLAKNGAFRSTLHGSRDKGPERRPDQQRGSCVQCHDGQARQSSAGFDSGREGLFAQNDNQLCFECHAAPTALGLFPSSGEWSLSSHATSSRMIAPARSVTDANKCVNCHDPHGTKDSAGVVPSLLADRERKLCLSCHDGSQGKDIEGQMRRGAGHGQRARGLHDPREGDDPKRFSAIPSTSRHVSCADCHNSHVAATDRSPVDPPNASRRLAGVSRIQVLNGPAGSAPAYEWLRADDTRPAYEYEICFKCHSSWTDQPSGQPDFARLTNPANASFHPIQSRGTNANIAPLAFQNGLSSESIIVCSSCHTSDDKRVKGPHGSSYPYLLRRPSTATTASEPPQLDNLCFVCHTFEVYADPSALVSTLEASRFNPPSTSGHAYHVATQQIPCFACHETHGSATQAALIAIKRTPGIRSFKQTLSGGECTSTCHAPKTYTVNYPR